MRAPFALLLVFVALAVLLITLGSGETGPSTSDGQTIGTPATPIRLATSQPTPMPQPLEELPVAKWTEIDPNETYNAGDGTMYLLDLETGQLYSPTAEILTWGKGALSFIAWPANGQVEVGLLGYDGAVKGHRDSYLGEILGALHKLPGQTNFVSSRSIVAYEKDGKHFLYDSVARENLGEIAELPGNLDGWSPDGRYLSFSQNAAQARAPTIRIWDVETRQFVREVIGVDLLWAEGSNKFLYGAIDPDDLELGVFELRVHDVDNMTEEVIPGATKGGFWSPDETYVVIDATTRDEQGRHYAFQIYDLNQQRYVLELNGAWAAGWLDEGTLGIIGDVCAANRFYSIDVDCSNLEGFLESDVLAVAHPSPQGDRIAFSLPTNDRGAMTTVKDLATEQSREYATGDARLPPYVGIGEPFWSPDGKYLALLKPGGKGGACGSAPPQELQIVEP